MYVPIASLPPDVHSRYAPVSIMMFGFGFITIMQGLTRNLGGLLTTRFFLGVFEATIFPGCSYLIAMLVYQSLLLTSCLPLTFS